MNKQLVGAIAREMAPVIRRFVDDAIRPLSERLAAIEARPTPTSVRGGLIDRGGCLVLQMSDGSTSNLGEVVGKDGKDGKDAAPEGVAEILKAELRPQIEEINRRLEQSAAAEPLPHDSPGKVTEPEAFREIVSAEVRRHLEENPPKSGAPGEPGEKGEPGIAGRDGLSGLPGRDGLDGKDGTDGVDGKPGIDGLGFEDLTETLAEDGRTIIRRYSRGDVCKEFTHTFGVVLDRGVWRAGEYVPGDAVTWSGSIFIAQVKTTAKPETAEAVGKWRLAVKRGRDGKDGAAGKKGDPGNPGKDGSYLSERRL